MANQIETFGLNVHIYEGFDCDDDRLELENLVEDFRLVVSSILTANGPFACESIVMLDDLYGKTKIAWEVLKVQLILN
jgi:hypothetical protein